MDSSSQPLVETEIPAPENYMGTEVHPGSDFMPPPPMPPQAYVPPPDINPQAQAPTNYPNQSPYLPPQYPPQAYPQQGYPQQSYVPPYPNYPPPAAVEVSKEPATQQVVVIHEKVIVNQEGPFINQPLGAGPAEVKCQYCGNRMKTNTIKVVGAKVYCCFVTLCLIGLGLCSFVACCMDGNKDTEHYCAVCKKKVGVSAPRMC